MIRAAAVAASARARGLLVAAVLVGGCSAPASSLVPVPLPVASAGVAQAPPIDPAILEQACQFGAVVFDVGPVALCQKAVALAVERLGPVHPPLKAIDFVLSLCPPGAPCAEPTQKEGWVVFRFTVGAPLMVHVGPALAIAGVDGPLVAGAPEAVPAWLAKQLQVRDAY